MELDRRTLLTGAALGVAGVLVASAIHDGRLRREHLSGFGEGF